MIGKLYSRRGRTAAVATALATLCAVFVWASRVPASGELFKAIEEGSAKRVRKLLQEGANPNSTDADGMTALNLACKIGRHETVVALLNAGADPTVTSDSLTPFGWAATSDSVEVISALESYAPNAKVDSRTEPSLCYAKLPETVRRLARIGASSVTISKRHGMSALELALVERRYDAATVMMNVDVRQNPESLDRNPVSRLFARSLPEEPSPEEWAEIDEFVLAGLKKGLAFHQPDSKGFLPLDYLRNDAQREHISRLIGAAASVPARQRPRVETALGKKER